jgi:hypothetical protein
MSKAIQGAAMLAGALAIGTILFFNPMLAFTPGLIDAMYALAAGGIAMEAGAVANALTSQRGQNITTRMAAGLRQIVYGMQRVGGVTIYQSTTGSHLDQYNYIIVLASHSIDAIVNLFLDGRQVYWKQDGNGSNLGVGNLEAVGGVSPACTVTLSGGSIASVTATGGSGFATVKPSIYRCVIRGGGGSGAQCYATNSGSIASPVWTVVVQHGGSGFTSTPQIEIQGAYTWGGNGAADVQDPTQAGYGLGYGIGPDGTHYNFSGLVYCEARFGDQLDGDFMTSIQANDPTWGPQGGKTPWVGGCAYIYLKLEYNTGQFPSAPEIRLTINGKNQILDPRTGKTGFSTNWALQVADVLTDPVFGLGDSTVNQAQLIAAANVCDEQILTSQGYTSQWAQHIHYDTSTSPGDALQMMMPSAAGRLDRIGGQWYIWPAYWQGPSFTLDHSSLVDVPKWQPYRSFKDLINCVNGTYIAPNYPYAVVGNLYDANGWYYGTTNDLWPYAWQPTNFPQYAQDTLHGYSGNQWLTDDGGIVLPKELTLRGVIDIVQAQRVAKVILLRNRFQGSGTFPMWLGAYQMQPKDVMEFTFAAMGWSDKVLELTSTHFQLKDVDNEQGSEGSDVSGKKAQMIFVQIEARETDPSINEWSESEELTAYDVPAGGVGSAANTLVPPTTLALASSSSTALVGADGVTTPRLLATWVDPADVRAIAVQGQYRQHGSTAWIDAGYVAIGVQQGYFPVVSGVAYDVQIRGVRPNGTTSAWLQQLNFTAGAGVLSVIPAAQITGLSGVATGGTLSATAISGGTISPAVLPTALTRLNSAVSSTISVAAGASAQVGSGASASVAGSASAGSITLTTGTGTLAAGVICTVTFGTAFGSTPNGVCAFNGASVAGLSWTLSMTQLVLSVSAALAPSTTYTIEYSIS